MSVGNRFYDLGMLPLEVWRLAKLRRNIVQSVPGKRVLEIGIGTGLNLRHYPETYRVTGIEPYFDKLEYSRNKHQQLSNISYVQADAQIFPFKNRSFDGVIGTLVFCTIPNPVAAFREIKRVIKPEGYIRVLEHVRIPHAIWGRLQDWLTPVWKPMAGGCHLNRETEEIAKSAGLRITNLRSFIGGAVLDIELKGN